MAPDWMSGKGMARQAPAIAAKAAPDPAVSAPLHQMLLASRQAGRQTALESLIHSRGEARRLC